jgi:spore maturation protein CgeB
MKLFIVGPQWEGDWAEGTGAAAETLGHSVNLFYYRNNSMDGLKKMAYGQLPHTFHTFLRIIEKQLKSFRDHLMNHRLIASVREIKPDFIIILKGETISFNTLLALRKFKIPLTSWWVDDPFLFPEVVNHFDIFDMLFIFDKRYITNLEAQGIKNVQYLPCACDHNTFHPMDIDPSEYADFDCEVGYIATYYPERAQLLKQLKGFDVGLWGGGWEKTDVLDDFPKNTWRGRYIAPSDANKVYNIARMCPNIHHKQTQSGGLNTRTFEILAAGGFELVDAVSGLEDLFDVGREIITYSSPDQFRQLTEYYLAHPDERDEVTSRGRARVLSDHTYVQRVKRILTA